MIDPDRAAIVAACADAFTDPSTTHRRSTAARIGEIAADAGLSLREVAAAVIEAATRHWATLAVEPTPAAAAVQAAAGQLLDTTTQILNSVFDGYSERTRSELSTHDNDRSVFVADLLTGRADPGALAERAHRYGIRLASAHTVIVARGDGLTPRVVRGIDAALAQRFGEGNTLMTLRQPDLVCISAGGLRGVAAELAHRLLAEVGSGGWQIAVGRRHSGLTGIVTSLEEARTTLDLASRLGFAAPILNAADLLVFPVLLRDREAITDLVTSVLGPLTTARGGAEQYLRTLAVLFENQGNYAATARQLHLSVRAVTYRLDRIRALTGYHPGEPTQQFTLHTAVLGARLLDWPPAPP